MILLLSVVGMMQCVCLVDAFGNRTMRPCLISAVKLQVLAFNCTYIYVYCVCAPMCSVMQLKLSYILPKF